MNEAILDHLWTFGSGMVLGYMNALTTKRERGGPWRTRDSSGHVWGWGVTELASLAKAYRR